MDMFIFIIGFLAIIVGLVLLVFNLIKKRPVKKYGITMLVGLVLVITGLFMPMKDDSTVTKQDLEKKEIQDEGEVEEVTPYSKESLVREYLEDNPDRSPTEIAKNLGISRTTVYKYL